MVRVGAGHSWHSPTAKTVRWAEQAPQHMASSRILISIECFLCARHWRFVDKKM